MNAEENSMSGSSVRVNKKNNTTVLIVILVLELLSLLPWLVFSALGAMGFDSGFNWGVVFIMGPFWAYPFFIAICGFIAFNFNNRGKSAAALMTILAPPAISGITPFLSLFAVSLYEYVDYSGEFDALCKNAKIVALETVPPATSIAIIPEYAGMTGPRNLLRVANTPLKFLEIESHDLQNKVRLLRVTPVKDTVDASTDPLSQRRAYVEEPIERFSAEYLVMRSIIKMPPKLALRAHGEKVEVLRASDKKVISRAEFYQMNNNKVCPEGIGKGDLLSNHIAKSLNLPASN